MGRREKTYQEEGERIEWQTHSVETQPVEPHFVVFKSFGNIAPSEGLVSCCVTVALEA